MGESTIAKMSIICIVEIQKQPKTKKNRQIQTCGVIDGKKRKIIKIVREEII